MMLELRVHVARAIRIGGEGPEGGLRARLQEVRSVTVVGREFEVFSFKFQATAWGHAAFKGVPRWQLPVVPCFHEPRIERLKADFSGCKSMGAI